MEKYLSKLLEQIRCKKARTFIEQEIRGHMEDQIADNKSHGMSEEQAVRAAVKDMGDPVETGISLDRIHKPQAAWSMIIIMVVISLFSILVHIMIGQGTEEIDGYSSAGYITRAIRHIVIGFIAMLIVYRIDYSFMAKYAKVIAAIFLGFMFLQIFFLGDERNGAMSFISLGGISISAIYFMLLFVPVYGAILYQYHGLGYQGIIKSIFWMLVPAWLTLYIPCTSLSMTLFFMMAVLLSIAVRKDWFHISKKNFLIVFWSVIVALPILLLLKLHWLADYQSMRIRVLLSGEISEYNYVGRLIKEYAASSKLFGTSGKKIIGVLPEYSRSYILTVISTYYGIITALIVCCLLAFVTFKIFRISLRQKNQLGMIMGCGCGMVFLTNLGINIGINVGIFPTAQTFLPFFSSGGTGIIVSYILIGIILSIYRYKNILPTHVSNKISNRFIRRRKAESSYLPGTNK